MGRFSLSAQVCRACVLDACSPENGGPSIEMLSAFVGVPTRVVKSRTPRVNPQQAGSASGKFHHALSLQCRLYSINMVPCWQVNQRTSTYPFDTAGVQHSVTMPTRS